MKKNRRSDGSRVPMEDFGSNLGPILELGSSSVKIRCTKAPADLVTIEMDGESGRLQLDAELVTSEPAGKKWDAVFRFAESASPQLRQQALRVAMAHRRHAGMAGAS